MNIIITGANGFIGKNLINLLNSENNILAISPHNNNLNNFKNIKYIKSTNKELIDYKKEILEFNPNCIIFNGWNGGNNYDFVFNHIQLTENAYPLINLLENIKNEITNMTLIGIGSGAELGFINKPSKESDKTHPVNLYGISKLIFGQYIEYFATQYNHRWIWVRPCNLYGYGDVPTRHIPKVINACLFNRKIVLNDCLTILDYLYIEDFLEGFKRLIKSDTNGIFNMGSGIQTQVKECVLLIQKIIGGGQIIFDSSLNQKSSPQYVCLNMEKTISTIGNFCSYNLNSALVKIINKYSDLK